MTNRKILLFAKSGQLGWELNRSLFALGDLSAVDRSDANFEDTDSLVRVIRQIKPAYIINPAAYTSVDQAEIEQQRAYYINAVAPGVLAEEARRLGAVLIHYSTDYVFDGTATSAYTENDQVNPLNVYGKSKLMGEQAVTQVGCAHVILRTSWVYSLRGDSFVTKTLAWARNQETLRIVSDQVGSPTWARMLAETSAAVIAQSLADPQQYFSERSGIFHLGGMGSVSRFDFACTILRLDPHAQQQIVRAIQPAVTSDFPLPAQRPLYTALDCSHFERTFDIHLPKWEMSLRLALSD